MGHKILAAAVGAAKRIAGLVAFVGALALGPAAWAYGYPPWSCVGGCFAFDGSTYPLSTDYTVPDDGLLYNWNFWSDSAHPDVLISVQSPNETFGEYLISNGDGTSYDSIGPSPWYAWDVFQRPGFTLIQVRSEPSYNDCAGALVGEICGYSGNVWGNGTSITVNTDDPVEIFVTQTLAIPEPQTWLMMLAGLFGVGAVMRLSRRERGVREARA